MTTPIHVMWGGETLQLNGFLKYRCCIIRKLKAKSGQIIFVLQIFGLVCKKSKILPMPEVLSLSCMLAWRVYSAYLCKIIT